MWKQPFYKRVWLTGRYSALLIVLLSVAPVLPIFDRPYVLAWLIYAIWFATATVSFDFSAGWINIVNLGYAAFIGVGGYCAALSVMHLGVPVAASLLLGAVAGALVGLVLGLVVLRFRGIYAALASWFLSLALAGLAANLTTVTRGNIGLSTPVLYTTTSALPYYYTALAIMTVVLMTLTAIVASRLGLSFRALGANVDAARASGVAPIRFRILNFTISCACGGLLGAFYAAYYGVLTPAVMEIGLTVQLLVAAMIGGSGSVAGAMFGGLLVALLYQALQGSLQSLPGLSDLIFGFVLVVIVILYPGGLAGAARGIRRWLTRRPQVGGRLRALRPLQGRHQVARAEGEFDVERAARTRDSI